jgi:TolB-like protein/DNA-binding CsgD family transcriptional regulator
VTTSSASGRPSASPADLGLTDKQVDVLALLMQGKSNKAICRALTLAEPTVKYHVTTILKALRVTNRTEAVVAIAKLGWELPPTVVGTQSTTNLADRTRADVKSDLRVSSKAQSEAPNVSLHPSGGGLRSGLSLPDKPSIVVLPFANLSGDPAQEYFADGMVEDITIALGRLPWLFVIGSASAFTYKTRTADIRQIGVELGVRYALKGSVRKEGSRVRITCQLSETDHGGQIWADRLEDELDGIFAMQDRVAAHVSTVIAPALRAEEIQRARLKRTENLTAYDLFLRALPLHRASYAQNQEALRLLRKAIELDPSYSAAYGLAAWCYDLQKIFGWVPSSDPRLNEGVRLARIAAEMGSNDSEALWMTAHSLTLLAGELELAFAVIKRATALNPNSPNAWWVSGTVNYFLDNTDVALEYGARVRRLSPRDPMAFIHWFSTGMAYLFAGRYQEAADAADRSLAEHPNLPPALRLKVVTSGLLGRIEEGHEWVARLRAVNPDATVAGLKAFYEPLLRINPSRLEIYLKGLRLSGLPEGKQ